MKTKPVFRYSVRGEVEGLISDVLRSYGITSAEADPQIEGVAWNPVYQGFCTCGFDGRFADWIAENRHATSCGYPARECSCGVWAELEKWSAGEGHSHKCKKSKPTFTICGVGIFIQPDGKIFASVDYGISEWRRWVNRAISEARRAVA